MFDDVNDLFKWVKLGGGEGSVVEKSAERVYEGDFACKLSTGWDFARDLFWVRGFRTFTIPARGLVQLDIVWHLKYSPYWEDIQFLLGFDFGDWAIAGWVHYRVAQERWEYADKVGNWRSFEGGSVGLEPGCWHRLRVTVDTKNKVFGKCWSNGQVWKVEGLEPYNTDWGVGVMGSLMVLVYGGNGTWLPWPVDDWIIDRCVAYVDTLAIRRV